MTKVCLVLSTLLTACFLLPGCKKETPSASAPQIGADEPPTLTVYCYDSFASDWGAGPSIAERFEEKYGAKVILEAPGDAVTLLSQAILEKKNPRGDVIVGLDNNLLSRALDEGILLPYQPSRASEIAPELILDEDFYLTPYDWGFFAICYDSDVIADPPRSLEELLDPRFEDSLVVMDPRTSTPGMGFLLWTIDAFGEEGWRDYWERLDRTLLTVSDGWSSGYGLFTEGEAPLVLSYSSSPAYHVEWEDTTRYRSLIFDGGNYIQIEGMGILKGTAREDLAKKFIDFMLTEESQITLATSNVMFPAMADTPLPASFDYALKTDRIIMTDHKAIEMNQERWMREWVETVSR